MAAATLGLGLAACGDDDDDTAEPATTADQATTAPATTEAPATTAAPATTEAPATTAAPATTEAPATTAAPASTAASDTAGAGDADAFCAAELEVEAAVSSEDPAVIGPALEALQAAAPAEVKATVEDVIANAQAGPDSPEFAAAYGEMVGFIKDNCGFTDLTVTATEYAFDGLPQEIPAGPAVITLENSGQEFHEILLLKINDGVTETADELLALPQRRLMRKGEFAAGAFAPNGATSYTVTDLQPGRHIAVCFLPIGATPEAMEEMEHGGSELETPPHFTAGMVQEFEVTS